MSLLNSDKHRSIVSVTGCPGVGYGFADALQTLVDLRHCEGTTTVAGAFSRPGLRDVCVIIPGGEGLPPGVSEITINSENTMSKSMISPLFLDRHYAQAALQIIGPDRVALMFDALHSAFGIEGEPGHA